MCTCPSSNLDFYVIVFVIHVFCIVSIKDSVTWRHKWIHHLCVKYYKYGRMICYDGLKNGKNFSALFKLIKAQFYAITKSKPKTYGLCTHTHSHTHHTTPHWTHNCHENAMKYCYVIGSVCVLVGGRACIYLHIFRAFN